MSVNGLNLFSDAGFALDRLVVGRDGVCVAMLDEAIGGRLCSDARWILESRAVYLRKKRGPAPRPIRATAN